MKHTPIEELREQARVTTDAPESVPPHVIRRQRLERFAAVLERHQGPVKPLSRIEYLPSSEWSLLRADQSPLTIAYHDPVLRKEGLESDRLGDAMAFFKLSPSETHELLCDCHYAGAATGPMIATRARALANRVTLRQLWSQTISKLRFW
jgi:hypothetical protein